MKYVEIVADAGSVEMVAAIAAKAAAADFRPGIAGVDGLQQMRMLVSDDQLQVALDALENILETEPAARIVVLSVEASLPKSDEVPGGSKDSSTTARELMYEGVERGARLDWNFVLLVVLSTIVAAIGLIKNNVAVVIGAMLIAPLLGPNLALSFGTAVGDGVLMRKSARTILTGILLAVVLSAIFGLFWPSPLTSHELLSRTRASPDSIALALASGAAASLSLTSGLPAVLVGVMVAVALLPPAATLGIMLGQGNLALAAGAGLLLAVNIVCVNLASKIVFFVKGIHPRTWLEKEKARRAMLRYVMGWVVTLLMLLLLMYLRHS
ncbi:MAG: TIGR00341 family protein [Gammaproteobacteria bacterium]|nr:TIGR00341 family protein [Gammaproteobacteria bacterium]